MQDEETVSNGLRGWRPPRQFNSAMGIGIDAPPAQPHTSVYDVHDIQQGGAPPWHSSGNVQVGRLFAAAHELNSTIEIKEAGVSLNE